MDAISIPVPNFRESLSLASSLTLFCQNYGNLFISGPALFYAYLYGSSIGRIEQVDAISIPVPNFRESLSLASSLILCFSIVVFITVEYMLFFGL